MTESPPGDIFQPGDLLNNTYRIEAILVRGDTSEVYRARSENSGQLVALKVLKADPSANDSDLVPLTRTEGNRDIRHDAIARHSEIHRTPEGHVYLVMDHIEGPSLDDKLKQGLMSADDLLDDVTAIAPTQPAPTPPSQHSKFAKVQKNKGKRGLVVALGVLLFAGGGASAYFAGLLGPSLPVADPCQLTASRPAVGDPGVTGNAPSELFEAAIASRMSEIRGGVDLSLAKGNIAETWEQDVLSVLDTIAPLEEWQLEVQDNTANLHAITIDRDLYAATQRAFANGMPGALSGEADVILGPLLVTQRMLAPILAQNANCGPLKLPDHPALGFGLDDTITITGQLAEPVNRTALTDNVRAVSGGRDIKIDIEILNPSLCLIESFLPDVPDSDIDISFRFGDTLDPNASGQFFVGENPVIDVVLPDNVRKGFLSVSILDVSGNVFHLLPNANRTDNSVATLRSGSDGTVPIRVAYAISEADSLDKLAFQVDESTLGKSKIVVIHTDRPMFDGPRPTVESASGYAEALRNENTQGDSAILSLDSKILVTAEP